jgi:hypothetical protein
MATEPPEENIGIEPFCKQQTCLIFLNPK